MTTDTTERGLERHICTVLAGPVTISQGCGPGAEDRSNQPEPPPRSRRDAPRPRVAAAPAPN